MRLLLLSALFLALFGVTAAQFAIPQPLPAYLHKITFDAVGICKHVKCGEHDKCKVVGPHNQSNGFWVECVAGNGK